MPIRYPTVFNLSDVNGKNGFVFQGKSTGDESGASVAGVGDVDNDGYDDIVICAPHASPRGQLSAGECYLIYGDRLLGISGSFDLSSLDGWNGCVFEGGTEGDLVGVDVVGKLDFNGDGFPDFLVGALYASPAGRTMAGESYLVYGGVRGGAVFNFSLLDGIKGFILRGKTAGDYSGAFLSAIDWDLDGYSDLLISAHYAANLTGETYLVRGGKSVGASGIFELSSLDGENGFVFRGISEGDYCGFPASIGDVNGDERPDLLIGASHASPGGRAQAGESYVIWGDSQLGKEGIFRLSQLNGTNGYVLRGRVAGDYSGLPASYAGDFNGDGYEDILLSAPYASPQGREKAGEGYLVYGGPFVGISGVIELSALDGSNGFVIEGASSLDAYGGYSLSSIVGMGGNNSDDLLIGAEYASPVGRSYAGESYLLLGGSAVGNNGVVDLSLLTMGNQGTVFEGAVAGDVSGCSFKCAGDVNGDGIPDMLIGAKKGSPGNRTHAGESYVIFGDRGPDIESLHLSVSSGQIIFPGFLIRHPRYTPEDLYYTVLFYEHIALPRTKFFQSEFNNRNISFVHDGGKFPPRICLEVSNGFATTGPHNVTVLFATNTHQSLIYIAGSMRELMPIEVYTPSKQLNVSLTLSDVRAGTVMSSDTRVGEYDKFMARWHASATLAKINEALASLYFSPSPSYSLSFNMSVMIVDEMQIPIIDTILVEGRSGNQPPITLYPRASGRALIGEEFSFDFRDVFFDPDGDPLTYNMISRDGVLPEWLRLGNGVLSGLSPSEGETTVLIAASDGLSVQEAYNPFTLTITKPTPLVTPFDVERTVLLSLLGACFTLALFFWRRWYSRRRPVVTDLSPNFDISEFGARGRARIEYDHYVVRPFAKVLRKELDVYGTQDLSSTQGVIFVNVIRDLLENLKQRGYDLEAMSEEDGHNFAYQTMLSIVELMEADDCANMFRHFSFFKPHVVTPEKIRAKLLEIVNETVIKIESGAMINAIELREYVAARRRGTRTDAAASAAGGGNQLEQPLLPGGDAVL